MDNFFIFSALALPVLLGGLWLSLLVPLGTPGRVPLVWGNGALLGLLLLPLLMRGLDTLGIPLTFRAIGSPGGGLILIALATLAFTNRRNTGVLAPATSFSTLPTSQKALFLFILLLILLRVTTLGLEVFWRPLFPWDATMHWATKARVWFELHSMAPFVSNQEWLSAGGEGVFTDRHPNYPATIPLIQVWMSLAMGRWDESLMNLPWVVCFIALGGAFYGQLRNSRVAPAIAIVFTYLLLSTPFVNIHVALAGYADLFLGAAYCGALMAFHNWTISKKPWQAALAIFFALLCPLIKSEGFIWSLTLVPALAITLMAPREAARFFLLLVLLVILLYLVIPEDQVLAGHSFSLLTPRFNPDSLVGIVKSTWLHQNWHLFGYLLLLIIPLGLIMPGALTGTFLPLGAALGCAVAGFLFLFLFTGFGWGASNFAAVTRFFLQLIPGLFFLTALLVNELLERGSIRSRPQAPVATA